MRVDNDVARGQELGQLLSKRREGCSGLHAVIQPRQTTLVGIDPGTVVTRAGTEIFVVSPTELLSGSDSRLRRDDGRGARLSGERDDLNARG